MATVHILFTCCVRLLLVEGICAHQQYGLVHDLMSGSIPNKTCPYMEVTGYTLTKHKYVYIITLFRGSGGGGEGQDCYCKLGSCWDNFVLLCQPLALVSKGL